MTNMHNASSVVKSSSEDTPDERDRVLAQAKFLRREGDGILSQRIWNIAADIELAIATLVTTAVSDASAWLSKQRKRL
jgi:hypothetical protein